MTALPPLEQLDRPGEHLWVVVGALAVADPERPGAAAPIGGAVEGLGCIKCEREYSRRLARRKCAGSLEYVPERVS